MVGNRSSGKVDWRGALPLQAGNYQANRLDNKTTSWWMEKKKIKQRSKNNGTASWWICMIQEKKIVYLCSSLQSILSGTRTSAEKCIWNWWRQILERGYTNIYGADEGQSQALKCWYHLVHGNGSYWKSCEELIQRVANGSGVTEKGRNTSVIGCMVIISFGSNRITCLGCRAFKSMDNG